MAEEGRITIVEAKLPTAQAAAATRGRRNGGACEVPAPPTSDDEHGGALRGRVGESFNRFTVDVWGYGDFVYTADVRMKGSDLATFRERKELLNEVWTCR